MSFPSEVPQFNFSDPDDFFHIPDSQVPEDSEFIVEDLDLDSDFMPLPEQEIPAPVRAPVVQRQPTRRIRPPAPPANFMNQPPPFPAPYSDATFQPFTDMHQAKSYVARVNNRNDAYIAIPIAFINRIRDDPRRMGTYGYIIHH